MDAIECMMSRQSVSAAALADPVPTDDELQAVFATAMRAPDHGALQPWRFRLIRGAARERLGDLYAAAARRANPDLPDAEIEKARAKPLRSPLIIAAWASVTEGHPKVPPVEQVVAAGAAVQNVLNALHAKGYGAILVTGKPSYDAEVMSALGMAPADTMIGFIYVGTPSKTMPQKKRADAAAFVEEWTGPLSVAAE